FGLGAIKGVGGSAVDSVVSERKQNGPFLSVFDLTRRIDLRSVNKKSFESMANAGAFDCFEGTHRAQYFFNSGDGQNFLEKALRYGNRYQDNENAAQVSLFGDSSEVQMPEPEIPDCPEWGAMEKLAREKEVVGIYISGHPLDDYRVELNTFCNATLELLQDLSGLVNKDLSFGGVVTDVQHRINAKGSGWASFVLEDYSDSYTFRIFGEDYMRFRHLLVANSFLYIRAHVKPGWDNKETGKAGDPRITFSNMQLLQDVMDAMAEKLSIQLNLKDIDEELINAISSIIDEHNGKHNLRIEVYDMEESIKLSLPSRNYKVNISQELLKELEEQQIHYKLN
ncbi:MAG: DNA polymerase III subunit alpha, partial [Flavobacteriaceae bacterium]|nr:DNA polymerase III subunit alpha [Flavobacteriaceae bacterium]